MTNKGSINTKLSKATAIYEEAERIEMVAFRAASECQSEYLKAIDAFVVAKESHDKQEMERLSLLIEVSDKSRQLAQSEYQKRSIETEAARRHETNLRHAIEASKMALEIANKNLENRMRERSLAYKAAKDAKIAFNDAHKKQCDAARDYLRLTSPLEK